MLNLSALGTNSKQFFTVRLYTPAGMVGWATEGVRWRHKVTAITGGTVSILLSTATDDGASASASRSALSSADGSYQWITIAGASLSAWVAGEYIEVTLEVRTSGDAAGLTVDVGRVELCWQ